MAGTERLRLTDQEQQEIRRYLDANKPLPEKYRFLLFEDKREVELVWNGKTNQVCNLVLPFQTIEHVDEPRAEHPSNQPGLDLFDARGRQESGWTNKLIWGDNKLILSSLKNGPLRDEIEKQGGLKLIYIDPPFDVGADFSMDIAVGEETLTKKPNILEEIAYRDTWGKGADSFIAMIYERLILMRDLLAEDGSIYVHCDWRVTGLIRLALDEVFGKDNIRNEIIWTFTGPASPGMQQFNRKHNTIYWFSKSRERWIFEDKAIRIPHDAKTAGNFKSGLEGSGFRADTYELPDGKLPESWWEMAIAQRFPVDGIKRVGYPTEKPWALIKRIIQTSSREGDLVADFFGGGGVVAAVSEMLGRKWLATDLGKFAIHTTRKRMIGVQRELKKQDKPYRAFEILNMGKYERQMFIVSESNGEDVREQQVAEMQAAKDEEFLELILRAYQAQVTTGFRTFQGMKAGRLVAVGPVNMPVTRLFIEELVLECRDKKITRVDVLAFEFEMGLFPQALDEAAAKGIDIQPKHIPAEVFDKRAVDRGHVVFYDVAYVEATPHFQEPHKLAIELTDFSVFYSQDANDQVISAMKDGSAKVVVAGGQVVKVIKDRHGTVTRETLTTKWTDWVDYWSIDLDYENKKELIHTLDPGTGEWRPVWTGDFTFENEWQSFRTKQNRSLELKTPYFDLSARPGRRKIAVKVVDIFGNDTMKLLEVTV